MTWKRIRTYLKVPKYKTIHKKEMGTVYSSFKARDDQGHLSMKLTEEDEDELRTVQPLIG